jgi:hypothetical protein
MSRSRLGVGTVIVACFTGYYATPDRIARAVDVTYSYDDGTSELGVGIDPGEDSLWFSRFPVQSGGEIITAISVAYGRPGSGSLLNGLPVTILLYEDVDGGAPWNAVLKQSVAATVANANTNTLNNYPIPATEVHGTLLAAALFRNTTTSNRFIAALDRTEPHVPDASFYGYTVDDLNINDLSTIPQTQRGTIESINFAGNWLIRATGQPVPEPGAAGCALALSAAAATRGHRRRGQRVA